MLWHDAEFEQPSEWVIKGHPVGQFYGLGGSWSNWKDFDEIVEDLGPDTPANEVRSASWKGVFLFLRERDTMAKRVPGVSSSP